MSGFTAGGCLPIRLTPVDTASVEHVDPVAADPVLKTGDRVRITVYGEDRLTGDYEVNAGGFISLPLVGQTKAAGLTQAVLRDAVADGLRKSALRDPRVTIDVVSLRPFYILGEVEKPGEYPYRSGLDVWRAMAMAGGQTYRASTSTVAIQRAGEAEWRDYKLASAVTVGPGDVVRIPERWF